jgi:hypothetical protein
MSFFTQLPEISKKQSLTKNPAEYLQYLAGLLLIEVEEGLSRHLTPDRSLPRILSRPSQRLDVESANFLFLS